MCDQLHPLKVWTCDRSVKKSLTASSLADLIEKGRVKLGLTSDAKDLHVVLEEDGTEVDDEDYFSFIPPNSTLMLLEENEVWQPARLAMRETDVSHLQLAGPVSDETDHGGASLPGSGETARLALDLRGDLSRIITFSNDQLQQLVDEDNKILAHWMGESERFAKSLQDACQRQLDNRNDTAEISGLLKLYHKAHETVLKTGVKRKAANASEDS